MKLETFDFNAAPVRVILRDGSPWFVAADVCRVLDLADASSALRELEEDEKITQHNERGNPRAGIPHQFNIVSESGLYALIFKSRKPEAKAFRKWVTSEVLPTIRKAGKYETAAGEHAEPKMSILAFVRECCSGWGLAQQTDFGLAVRRYAKAMGVIFEITTEPGLGRVFAFPRPVLEHVRLSSIKARHLPDSDAVEFERFLEGLHRGVGDGQHMPEVARGVAKTLGLFPRIFGENTSLASERSGFGRLCERFHNHIFPSGLRLRVRGEAERRRYEVARLEPELALPT